MEVEYRLTCTHPCNASEREAHLRIPRDSNIEPQVIASIDRYRRRTLFLRLAAAVPLMAGVITSLVVYLYVLAGDGKPPAIEARLWVAVAVIAGVFALFVLLIGPEKMPLVLHPDHVSLNVFQNALEGVSVAAGVDPPRLLVLDLPTANSISLFDTGRPAVGVTTEALEAALPRRCAEAMMAHELSHVLLGDVVVGSNTRRWRLVGLSLDVAIVLPFVLLALAFGFGTWTYLGLFGWTALTVMLISVIGRLVTHQNDLLADSLAAKMTSDPGALKEAILLLDAMFLKNERPFSSGTRYPTLLFIYEVRPEVDLIAMREMMGDEDDSEELREAKDLNLLKSLRKGAALPRTSTEERIENLEAIERGHWRAFKH